MSTMTPMTTNIAPLHALQRNRKTHVMAIINATPDSFSDGGVHTTESLRTTIASFVEDGATILDVGGQSTAPGTPEVSAEEEMSRVLPVIKLIRDHPQTKDAIISVDTYRAAVAEAAILAGADIVNDVSAGTLDEQMLPTVARLGKTICLMHMRGTPGTMTTLTDYGAAGLVPTLADELQQRVAAAERAGIRRWRLLLDPGIGFAKSAAQNLELLRRFDELRDWPGLRGLPWLLGPSRKSFVGRITGVADPRQRVWGTAAAVAAAVQGGADIVRVHDVRPMVQVVKMADAIWRV
ncbi:MAG: trifunctional dihydropteroate synthetase [Claussenomyces sp. TS43310]|nr:MAG: trifunctional dihydropteroate synthetase [Claussenomyces sp. TS43310]